LSSGIRFSFEVLAAARAIPCHPYASGRALVLPPHFICFRQDLSTAAALLAHLSGDATGQIWDVSAAVGA
jgi:hypothetical protein